MKDLIKVTDRLPEKGTDVLIFSSHSGFSVAKFTDRNLTYGYRYKEPWFTKGGRQLSKKTVTHWAELPERPNE